MSKCTGVYMLTVINSIFSLLNVQIRAVPSCKSVDLLVLKNSVFTMRNVEIWAVTSSNEVHLLMLRNRVFRLRNVEKLVAVMQGVHSADIHEFRFQAAKRSDMDCVELQSGPFAEFQELQFQAAKVQLNAVQSCKRVDLLMFSYGGFRLRHIEICEVLSSYEVYLLKLRNRVFSFRNIQI